MSSADTRAGRPSAIVAMLALGIMLIAVLMAILKVGPNGFSLPSLLQQAPTANPSQATPAPTQYVARLVRVRNAPTSDGSAIVESLGRGAAVNGAWVTGSDGKTTWLRVSEANGGFGFIWSKNLAPVPRPALKTAADQDLDAVQPTVIRSEPAPDSSVLDTVPAGSRLHSVGTLAGGAYELLLKGGGVGYVSVDTVSAAAPPSGGMASFNCAKASSCDERLICSDEALATADRRLAGLYANAMSAAASNHARSELRASQRGWIGQRKTCEATPDQLGCLRSLYQARANALGSSVPLF